MIESTPPPYPAASSEPRPWRPDWADGGVFLVALTLGLPVGWILAKYDGEPSITSMVLAVGCFNLILVAVPFTFIRWLIFRANRRKGLAGKPRAPLLAFIIGSVMTGGMSFFGLASNLSIRLAASAAMKTDIEHFKEAALSGKPLPDLNPDNSRYGAGQPLMKFALGKLRPYAENARAIQELKAKVGTPLKPPAVFDPAQVRANAHLIQELQDRVILLRNQLDGFAGPSGMAELEKLDMPTGYKLGFQSSMKAQEASYLQAKASLEATSKVYEQIHRLLIFLQQHPPKDQGGKLLFESSKDLAAYQTEYQALQRFVAEENRLFASDTGQAIQ